MNLWHNAAFDLPALGVVTFEEDLDQTSVLMSDPVLVYTKDGEMYVAMYEEDETIDFRGWVAPCCASTLRDITHWTELPRPPKGATP